MLLLPFLAVAGLALLECSASPTPQIEDFEINNLGKIQKGEELFESDIILTAEQWEAVRLRKAINNEGARWPEGSDGYPLVPYLFFDTSVNRDAVKAGINHWMEHTCIKFEETTNENQAHLKFYNGDGCHSLIGVASSKGQKISIGGGCNKLNTVVHEIGHAMGFWHEQNRSDRDDYVAIKWDNINGKFHAFKKVNSNNYDVKYDYGSVMHYGSFYFHKNGKMTIVTKDPLAQELLGSSVGLSHRDKLLANMMYKCIDKWASKCGMAADYCKNEGYLGANCACVCPPGTSGDKCQTVSSDYYAHLRSEHTETITTEKTFSHVRDAKFTKKIVAPECKLVKLTFTNFDLYKKKTNKKGLKYCHYEYIFLRSGKDLTEGGMYCEKDIAAGQSFTSETDTMVLFSRSRVSKYGDGWTAKVEFVEDPRCTPGYTTPTPTTTEPTPPTLVKCVDKPETQKVFAGDSIEIQSPNYPNNYPTQECGWKLKGFGTEKVKVSCSNFRMEAPNKKGECLDYLEIGTEKFCGDNGPVDVTISVMKKAILSFKSNRRKFKGGFSCTVTAISE